MSVGLTGLMDSDERAVGEERRRLNRYLVIGLTIVGLIVLTALVSFIWTPYDPTEVDADARLAAPSASHAAGHRQVRPRRRSAS